MAKNLENQRIFEENNGDSVNLKDIAEKHTKTNKNKKIILIYIVRFDICENDEKHNIL